MNANELRKRARTAHLWLYHDNHITVHRGNCAHLLYSARIHGTNVAHMRCSYEAGAAVAKVQNNAFDAVHLVAARLENALCMGEPT